MKDEGLSSHMMMDLIADSCPGDYNDSAPIYQEGVCSECGTGCAECWAKHAEIEVKVRWLK